MESFILCDEKKNPKLKLTKRVKFNKTEGTSNGFSHSDLRTSLDAALSIIRNYHRMRRPFGPQDASSTDVNGTSPFRHDHGHLRLDVDNRGRDAIIIDGGVLWFVGVLAGDATVSFSRQCDVGALSSSPRRYYNCYCSEPVDRKKKTVGCAENFAVDT